MLRIDLLRHGETELSHCLRGSTDDELTLLGWQQMRNTINQYSTEPDKRVWDVIYSSPLQRCHQFSSKLSQSLDLSLIVDKNLQEMHFGDWEAISSKDIYDQYPEDLALFWQKPTTFTPPNAEPIQEFDQRITACFMQIIAHALQMHWTRILIVTHAGVIKLFKTKVLNQPLDDILKMSAELGQLNSFQLIESKKLILHCAETSCTLLDKTRAAALIGDLSEKNDFKLNFPDRNSLKLILLDPQKSAALGQES